VLCESGLLIVFDPQSPQKGSLSLSLSLSLSNSLQISHIHEIQTETNHKHKIRSFIATPTSTFSSHFVSTLCESPPNPLPHPPAPKKEKKHSFSIRQNSQEEFFTDPSAHKTKNIKTHTNLTPDDAQEKFLPPPKPQLPINFFIVITNKHTIKKILLHAGVDDSFALQKKNINLLIEDQKKQKPKGESLLLRRLCIESRRANPPNFLAPTSREGINPSTN
jgi:hypothetical protein